jgi:hypothetical protein
MVFRWNDEFCKWLLEMLLSFYGTSTDSSSRFILNPSNEVYRELWSQRIINSAVNKHDERSSKDGNISGSLCSTHNNLCQKHVPRHLHFTQVRSAIFNEVDAGFGVYNASSLQHKRGVYLARLVKRAVVGSTYEAQTLISEPKNPKKASNSKTPKTWSLETLKASKPESPEP